MADHQRRLFSDVQVLPGSDGAGWDVQHIPRPRKERSLPPVLSRHEIQKIINHGGAFKHLVFMMLLYSTGLRLSEALNLRLADIDGDRLQIRVVKGKGAKDRYVEVPPCLLTLLRDYYRAYPPKQLLFNGKLVGRPWAQRSAQWSIHKTRRSASNTMITAGSKQGKQHRRNTVTYRRR